MKKIIISLAVALILFTGSPALAVGPKEWQKAVDDIATLQQQCGNNTVQIQDLTSRVQKLEQENTDLKSRVGIVEGLFNQLKGLLVQVVQMLINIKK